MGCYFVFISRQQPFCAEKFFVFSRNWKIRTDQHWHSLELFTHFIVFGIRRFRFWVKQLYRMDNRSYI